MFRWIQWLVMAVVMMAVAMPAQAASYGLGGMTGLVALMVSALFILVCGAVVINLAQRGPTHRMT